MEVNVRKMRIRRVNKWNKFEDKGLPTKRELVVWSLKE